jgi:hypothetical protein
MPGDGIFALFESVVDAVRCALNTQARLAAMPKLNTIRMRIGVHLGDVIFQDDLPFGETLVIASRLESLADPGGILVSATVMEAVAPRISAVFCEHGVFSLKHCPRRIETFKVFAPSSTDELNKTSSTAEPLDRTILSIIPGRSEASAPLSPFLNEPKVLHLPKAIPLVVPHVSEDAASGHPDPVPLAPPYSVAISTDTTMIQDSLAELILALTTYLGPVAGLLVKRHATNFVEPTELINALAHEIPAEAERVQFLFRARQVVARHRH